MVKIENFSVVLEIAFGLNALFFLFELVPRTEERIDRLKEKYDEAYKRKVEATGSTEEFPIGFLLLSTYPWKQRLMKKITIMMSLILLGFLIYDSFFPDAEISSWNMCILLLISFGIPYVGIRICQSPIRWLERAIRVLEKQTMETRDAKWKKEMQGENK